MPSNKQPRDPLAGAAPRLQPTARPVSIPIGATPPQRRSPLAELAQAFDGFNAELKGALQDAAIKADADAFTLGELEAQKQDAARRLGELETVAKELVDSGHLNKARSPAFKRGYSSRVGRDLARGEFHRALFSRLSEAAKVDDAKAPEAIIAEVRQEVASSLPSGDLYAQEAFDDNANASVAQFIQRATEERLRNLEAVGEVKMADEGAEILHSLAFAPTDEDEQDRLAAYREHLDTLRTELRKTDVNAFTLTRSLRPVVAELIQDGHYDEAEGLLQQVEDFDVTGKGGLLGKTADGRALLADLQSKVEKERRYASRDRFEEATIEARQAAINGRSDAGNTLAAIRQENAGNLPPVALKEALDNYRLEHGGNLDQITAFEDALDRARKYDEGAADTTAAKGVLARFDDSLADSEAEANLAALQGLYDLGLASAEQVTKASQFVTELKDVNGLIREQDLTGFQRDTFAEARDQYGGTVLVLDLNASHAQEEEELLGIYEDLSGAVRSQVVQQVTEKFREALAAKLRELPSLEERKEKRFSLIQEAQREARAHARRTLRALKRQAEQAQQQRAAGTTVGSGDSATVTAVKEALGLDTRTPEEIQRAKAYEALAEEGIIARPQPVEQPKPRTLGDLLPDPEGLKAKVVKVLRSDPKETSEDLWQRVKSVGYDVGEMDLPAGVGAYEIVIEGLQSELVRRATLASYQEILGMPESVERKTKAAALGDLLKAYGGAEYLTQSQLEEVGLDAEAFPKVGTKVAKPVVPPPKKPKTPPAAVGEQDEGPPGP